MTSPSTPSSPPTMPWGERPFSLLGAAALLIEGRRLLVLGGLVGGLLAIAITSVLPRQYTARAMFIADANTDSELGALRGLAGQFGIPIGGANSGPSPEFYQALATSTVLLSPIAAESVVVSPSKSAAPTALVDLLRARGRTEIRRRERATVKLQRRTAASYNRQTGVISLRVRTRWSRASEEVATRILARLNDFNLHTRQSRARAERVFAEDRVKDARQRLREAEEELLRFTERNRVVRESPVLTLEQERRAREVALAQQILASLEPTLEEARLREVKDTPVITVLQPPTVLSEGDSRRYIRFGLFGGIAGLLVAMVILPVRQALTDAGATRDPAAERFFRAVRGLRRGSRERSGGE